MTNSHPTKKNNRRTDILLDDAFALYQSGKWKKSEKLFRKVLSIEQGLPDAWHGLGALLHQRGEHDTAIKHIQKAISIAPDNSYYHSNLGEARRAIGDAKGAAEAYQNALRIDSNNPLFHNNLALALELNGDFAEALNEAQRALSIAPDFAPALNTLGNLHRLQGELETAISYLEHARTLAPNVGIVHNNLGLAYLDIGRLKEAELAFQKAVQLEPTGYMALNNLANLARSRGLLDDAARYYRQALKLSPKQADIWANLAFVLETLNNLDEAYEAANKAVTLCPGNPQALIIQGCLARRKGHYQEACDLLRTSLHAALPYEFESHALFNLGQALERLGDYSEAFAAYTKGKAATYTNAPKEATNHLPSRSSIKPTKAWLTGISRIDWSNEEPIDEQATPVFFVGFPRSGTTLLEQVLAAHPSILTLEEKTILPKVDQTLQMSKDYPMNLERLGKETISALRKDYWRFMEAALEQEPLNGRMLVDKLPLNIMRLATAYRLFPKSKFIIALRDPRDVCLSCFTQNFKLNHYMANFLTLDDTVDFYTEVMGLWDMYSKKLAIDFHIVRYEQLVGNLEEISRLLISFLGLPWKDDVLDYCSRAKSRIIMTPSYHQAVQPVYKSSIARWRHFEKELKFVTSRLEPFIQEYGYDNL